MNIVGRLAEKKELQRLYESGRPELLVVYGRRRVGKTYLLKEYFENQFAFFFTGTVDASNKENLENFDKAISGYGSIVTTASKKWSDAFDKLKELLEKNDGQPEKAKARTRKIVFIDEMPWLDRRGSDFLTAFDYFWNSWASSNPEILFIVCGSATSWVTKKLFKNRGGLHNRVTSRIYLAPLSLAECEEFFRTRNIEITRYQMIESYMIFGGIPYYLDKFHKGISFSQNVDLLCFAENAPLKDEYEELYGSLFNSPHRHMMLVEALSKKSAGLTRKEISAATRLPANGHLTEALNELEQSGFIERYSDFTRNNNGVYYYLKDPFTLFYLRYMKKNNTKDDYFWTNNREDGALVAWRGYAFEMLCRTHLRQIKQGLGILGVSTRTMSWRSRDTTPGAQIDLIISRKDGVTNLCEMKYTKHPYEISKAEATRLEYKKAAFLAETKTRDALHITLVTTYGLTETGYRGMVQSEIDMNDLFGR